MGAIPRRDVEAAGRLGAAEVGAAPGADEVRAALEHMATSEAFRGSPQLVAFLRYVVEATLRGGADRIKGYTIAVEALGRAEDFDPQADPIVRVEAMRLRRALVRYYGNGGKADPVLIDLPLGSYVPVFRRAAPAAPPACAAPAPGPPASPAASHDAPSEPAAAPPRRRLRRVAAALACLTLGAAAYAGFDLWRHLSGTSALAMPSRPMPAARDPSTYPTVFVGPVQGLGGDAQALRGKLRDVLARFDEIQVVATAPDPHTEPQPAAAGRYELSASVQPESAGRVTISLRLADTADGRIVYARSFEQVARAEARAPSEEAIAHEVAATLAQPYGIIQAHERARGASHETQYRCLTEAYEYWRSHDPQQHRHARDCLERALVAAPSFALGHAALAALLLEEFRGAVTAQSGERPALQRALQAARRAVELRPGSARAHQVLSEVQFARGDHLLGIEAGERAIALNPYDPSILADHGAHLVAVGEQQRGMRLLREAAAVNVVRPARQDFFLFLGAYLAGDPAGAARYAALMTSDNYPLGLMARALVAARRGAAGEARSLMNRLATFCPGWRDDSRSELKKYFFAETIVERISHDLAQIAHAH